MMSLSEPAHHIFTSLVPTGLMCMMKFDLFLLNSITSGGMTVLVSSFRDQQLYSHFHILKNYVPSSELSFRQYSRNNALAPG